MFCYYSSRSCSLKSMISLENIVVECDDINRNNVILELVRYNEGWGFMHWLTNLMFGHFSLRSCSLTLKINLKIIVVEKDDISFQTSNAQLPSMLTLVDHIKK